MNSFVFLGTYSFETISPSRWYAVNTATCWLHWRRLFCQCRRNVIKQSHLAGRCQLSFQSLTLLFSLTILVACLTLDCCFHTRECVFTAHIRSTFLACLCLSLPDMKLCGASVVGFPLFSLFYTLTFKKKKKTRSSLAGQAAFVALGWCDHPVYLEL